MGMLRTIFAITVILAHSWPERIVFVGGRNAVQCFYIISGFLILINAFTGMHRIWFHWPVAALLFLAVMRTVLGSKPASDEKGER